jgi:carboxyl-terminal processing protease
MKEKEKSEVIKSTSRKRSTFLFYNIVLVFIVFALGYYQGSQKYRFLENQNGIDLKVFWEAWDKLKEKSVDNISNDKMVEGAISGVLSSLDDPYTVYMSKKDNQRFREDIQGEFGGIGIEIVQKNNLPTVVTPLPDSPAEKAGLKTGDIIAEVDGTKSTDMSFSETIDKIRGEKGTKVTIKVLRGDQSDLLTFEVIRDKIVIKSVDWKVDQYNGKKIGYIKIKQFGDDTESLFSQAANEIKKSNPDGIILDLRNDPGGYLETAVNIGSAFIKDGVIVSEKGKNNSTKDYKATGNAILAGYRVVVLVNEGSASASEIVTGALKDQLGSKVVGKKTFGKGSVQELIDLSDGSAAKITIAKWYTPKGNQINGEGIKPDIEIGEDAATLADEQLIRAQGTVLNNN